jgi:hypothetical protein
MIRYCTECGLKCVDKKEDEYISYDKYTGEKIHSWWPVLVCPNRHWWSLNHSKYSNPTDDTTTGRMIEKLK